MSHYDTLGIKEDATQKEIKEAYKKLIKKYHPDVYPGDKSFAEKKTKEINYAYDILSNEELKKAYDEEINPSYNYTPPKYDNYESYSYKNYYQNSNSNFENYKHYTDYNQSKTQTQNYTTKKNIHNEFSDNIVNSVNKMSSKKKTILISTILFVYILFLIITFFQITSILKGKSSGTLLNTHITAPEIDLTIPNTTDNHSNERDDQKSYNDFNINDYISEYKLKELYDEYYYTFFDSYDDFKNALSDYLYYTIFNNL